MQTVLVTVGLVILAMSALGIGLAFGRQPLQRSCGSETCRGTCQGCERNSRSETS